MSKVTVTSCSFYIKCSMCPRCYWTTHSSRRRHRPMARSIKCCDSLSHSVTIACFSWLIVVNRRRWWTICWRYTHTARNILTYLRRENVTFIEPDRWPPNSPDLNPVVYAVWGALDISQGSVATHMRCGGIFSDSIITNFLLILTVKKFLKIG